MLLNKVSAFLRLFCFSFFGLTSIYLIATVYISTAHADTQNNPSNIHIRTLAASCAACHGTHGNSLSITPVLAGLDSHYFSTQMQAFKQGGRESTVMHHHATGLTDQEINQLADYFSQQQRQSPPPLVSQTLRGKP